MVNLIIIIQKKESITNFFIGCSDISIDSNKNYHIKEITTTTKIKYKPLYKQLPTTNKLKSLLMKPFINTVKYIKLYKYRK